ncbi:MAG: four helix bundle protein [Saprospiraceae bacterium]|nr:four helix bundle protein [Saprospiraceae bacterium]
MDRNLLKERTRRFAHGCVKLAANLPNSPLCNVIRYQLIKSATSSAANYRAACLGQSRAAFRAKLSIVIEELDESRFWLEFLRDEDVLSIESCESELMEANELLSIFISTRMSLDRRSKKQV